MDNKSDCQTVPITLFENEDTTTVNSDTVSLTDQLKIHRLPPIKEATKKIRKLRLPKKAFTPRED